MSHLFGTAASPDVVLRGTKGSATIAPQGHFNFDNGEGLLQAAEAGLGIAALPDFIASAGLSSGRLTSLLDDYPLEGVRCLSFVRRRASSRAKCARLPLSWSLGWGAVWQLSFPLRRRCRPH